MAVYRFYFLDGVNHIQEAEEHDFADDTMAIDNATAMCVRHGGSAVEIWEATRLVHRQKMPA